MVTGPSNNSSLNFNSNTSLSKELIPEVSPVSFKISEEKEIIAFLVKENKKSISDKIRQCNRKKKLQAQESLPIPLEEEMLQVLNSDIQPCNSSTFKVSENVNLSCPISNPVIHNLKRVSG